MESVAEAIEAIKPFAGDSGTCDDAVALDYLNQAEKLLWNKTDYHTTTEYICLKCTDNCFYLPSLYKQFRLAWIGNQPASAGDEWYQSVPGVGFDNHCSCHRKITNVGGSFVTFDTYHGTAQLAIQAESAQDAGAKLTVFASNQYGSRKKEQLTLAIPPERAFTKAQYNDVLGIIKPKTVGRVRLYAVAANGDFQLLAIYQPNDINPTFQKFRVNGNCGCEITLLCKKKFISYVDLNDMVAFPTDALIFATTALVQRANRDTQAYLENVSLAVAELNKETEDLEVPSASPMRWMHNNRPGNLEGVFGWGTGDGYGGWGGVQ